MVRFGSVFCAAWMLGISAVAGGEAPGDAAGVEFFEKKIRPVLVERCYACHAASAKEVKGGLLLDTRNGMLQGGDSGTAVVPGDAEKSRLLSALRYEDYEMPPDGRLPEEVVRDFEAWIRMGAPDPRDGKSAAISQSTTDVEQGREFWSFQPPRRHEAPQVKDEVWVRQPIDVFILARLEAEGLQPSPPADRRTLIRRLSFDLIGLPPMPEEVEAFVSDDSPEAYARLVERLLASPHFGERWARLWLDVARYAEDQAHIVGNDKSLFYPNAYFYRDWVIAAFNHDMPYDRFIRLQLAADLMDEPEHLAALGFIGLGPKYYRRRAREVMAEEWEDRVDTVTRGLLGLTVACARCHDHKFDPVPTEDYYSLAGVFASTEMFNRPLSDDCKTEKDGQAKDPEEAMHIVRDGDVNDLPVFLRGNVENEGPVAPRRFLQVLSPQTPAPFTDGSGRRELAEAIVDPQNPLAARVLVNRIWGQMFGRPLVATPSNFGALGEPPTHPELLDDVAARFMESGWSIKRLVREMAMSSVYRQCSNAECGMLNAELVSSIPHSAFRNPHLLWRMNRKRLDVERWRDAVLAAAGRLDRAVGGESIDPQDPEETRRTVYARISRLDLNEMLSLFDFPDPNAHSDRRNTTTTPLQKLFVINSPFMVRQAEALAERIERESPDGAEARIDYAYRVLYSRPPSDEELQLGVEYLGAEAGSDRWRAYAQVLLAASEMSFID
ncbi:MAG: PSD1 and planctomycete cytochrome C domain-containing protein [Planctomycetes bacterium]|nr:PSD1 and planctomycete cytochrome C domain-containing protein [Planctomycetota bacterium]